jgi:hypothetical protein
MSTLQGGGNIVRDGLVLLLDAANTKSYPGSGTVWTDLSRSGLTGSLVSGPTFNSANGGSIVFNGSSQYVNLGTGLNSNSLSISFWVNFNSLSNQVLITKGDWSTNVGASYTVSYYSNQLRFDTFLSDVTYGTAQYSFSPTLNIWYNLVLIADSINTTYSLYINGVNVIFTSTNTFRIPRSNSSVVNLGRNVDGLYPLNGKISITKIYNRALSATEILQNYNATKSRFGL